MEARQETGEMRPKTLAEPDRTTFYCDVQTRRFTAKCCKIMCHYSNGDCVVQMMNGIQFTARAEEIFYIRRGDYHEAAL